jgi:hypothetical protein
MKNTQQIEILEKYIRGRLPEADRQDLEERLKADRNLRKMLYDLELMIGGIRSSGAKTTEEEKLRQLEETLGDDLWAEVDEGGQTKVFRLRPWIVYLRVGVAAAVILLLLTIGINVLIPHSTPQDVFAEYYVAFEGRGASRGAEGEVDIRRQAELAYANENFEMAILEYNRLASLEDLDKIFLANAYLSTQQAREAINILQPISNNVNAYQKRAMWYLGLAHLQNEDVESAREVFEELESTFTEYRDDVQKILKKLKRLE